MRKLILCSCLMLFSASAAFASPQTTATGSDSGGAGMSVDLSNSRTKTDSKSNGKGGQKGSDSATGTADSESDDIRTSTNRMRENGVTMSSSLVPFFIEALAEDQYPWLKTLNVDDLLIKPIGLKVQYAQNLGVLAQRNATADKLYKLDEVRAVMVKLQQMGIWVQSQVTDKDLAKIMDGKYLSGEEWARMVARTADNDGLKIDEIQATRNVSGACYLNGTYNRIQCGSCVLDVSRTNGFPELTCMGVPVLTASAANGMQLAVNTSYKTSSSEDSSHTKHSERFNRAQKTMNDYVKWATDHGVTVAGARARKFVMDMATRDDAKVDVVIKAAERKDPPAMILGMMGLR